MKVAKYIALFGFVSIMASVDGTPCDAAQAKDFPGQRRGKAGSHTGVKESPRRNPLWSADPELGWVRNEDHPRVEDDQNATREQSQSKSRNHQKRKK